jgi:hypothetical protein
MRAATVVATAVVVVAAVTLVWFSGWVSIARWATDLHDAFGVPWPRLAVRIASATVVLVLAALAAFAMLPRRSGTRALAADLVIAATAALAAALLQRKGWPYHLLPVVQPAALALGLALIHRVRSGPPRRRAMATTVAVAATAALLWHAFLANNRAFRPDPAPGPQFAALARAYAAGTSFLALSTNQWPVFPAVVEVGASWASRAPHLWMIPGAVRLLAGDADERARGARYRDMALAMIADDIERARPAVLAVDVAPMQQGIEGDFDLLAFLRQDARLRALLDGYRAVARDEVWAFYVAGR